MYITAFVKLFGVRVVAARMERIDRELRMMPVDEGIVEADVQAFGAKCIGILTGLEGKDAIPMFEKEGVPYVDRVTDVLEKLD